MSRCLKTNAKFSIVLALSAVFAANSVLAQKKSEIADACIRATEAGDTVAATDLASQIKEWRHLFSTTTIKKAEQCLQAVTGEHWKYFSTKGRFLSDDEARAEQDFIDGADDRRAKQKEDQQRLHCEVIVAEFELSKLEEEYKSIKEARKLEAQQATLRACTLAYKKD